LNVSNITAVISSISGSSTATLITPITTHGSMLISGYTDTTFSILGSMTSLFVISNSLPPSARIYVIPAQDTVYFIPESIRVYEVEAS
jgi:hypothetical protein